MYIKYLTYLFRHKWYVFLECLKYGLIWQGIVHDLSKLLPDEFIPYAHYFYGGDKRKDAFYTPDQGDAIFNVAWLLHIHRNPHHWQHWILHEDDGDVLTLPMPKKYYVEMLCDWRGAARIQNNDVESWYDLNKYKIKIDVATRDWIEKEIGYAQRYS